MSWELNRATFRRLVQLYLVTLPIFIAAAVVEAFGDGWREFGDEFDSLSSERFGPTGFDTLPVWLVTGSLVLLLTWMIASNVGLLWFKRWARFGTWASVIVMYAVLLAIDGYRPSYTSPVYDWAMLVDGGLLGAILLLAYARNYGATWFAPDAETGI